MNTTMTMLADRDDAAYDVVEQCGVLPVKPHADVDAKRRRMSRSMGLVRPVSSEPLPFELIAGIDS